jgi:hypothetical protein
MCVFQSSLFEDFSLPHFHPDIDNHRKLDESGLLTVTVDPNLMDTLEESPVMRKFAAKFQH